jgi:hypothetical protein
MSDTTKKTLQEIIKDEIKKCMVDPIYFMKKYIKIQHPMRGTINFDLYPFQEETLRSFCDNQFTIVLKSRQMGISTLVASYSLWMMLFNKDKNILIISIRQEVAKEIITKVRFANENLPSWLKVVCEEDNRLSLKFKNGSQIRATSTTKKSGVSLALSLLIIDEAALIEDADDLWASAQPTLSTGGKSIILSTPRGVGNWFHRMWQKAEEKENEFVTIRLPWDLHPERDAKWREVEGNKMGSPKEAAQEYDCDFLSSGETVVDLIIVDWYKKTIMRDPMESTGIDRALWRWQYPDWNRSYIVCADVARGDGSDFSAAHVLDAVSLDQCAEYKGKIETRDFGNLLVTLSTEYNNALLIVEREGYGWSVLQQIIDRKYSNTFYSSADLRYVEVERQLTTKFSREEKKLVPGFATTLRTRPVIISHLEQYFREKAVNIYSRRMLSELEVFIWHNGKAQAMEGFNDDLVMALGIGLWVRDTALRLKQEGVDLMRSLVDKIAVTKMPETPVILSKNTINADLAWKMRVRGNETENLQWLL